MTRKKSEMIFGSLFFLEILVGLYIAALLLTMSFISMQDPNNVKELLTNSAILPIVLQTLKVGLYTAIAVTFLSYIIAFFCHTYIPHIAKVVIFSVLLFYTSSYYIVLLGWRALWGNGGLLSSIPLFKPLGEALSYGLLSIVAVMVLRYLPIGILLTYLRMRGLSVTQIYAAKNLGLSQWQIHRKLCIRWCLPALSLVLLFTIIFGSLDHLASSLGGGGNIQILGNLLDDWQRSHSFQGAAMTLGLIYTLLVGLFLFLLIKMLSFGESNITHISYDTETLPRKSGEYWLMLSLTSLVIIAEFSLIVAVFFLAGGWSMPEFPSYKGIAQLFSDHELVGAISSSIQISAISAIVGTVLALFSSLARHLRNNVRQTPSSIGFSEALLLIPLIVPPLLAGIAAGIFQGEILKYYGSKYSILTIHTITFAPLAYYVILTGLNVLSLNSYQAARNLGIGLPSYIWNIFLRSCLFTLPAGGFLIFAFSFNDSILARYVGGMERSLGILIANKQVAALEPRYFSAVALMFIITFIALLAAVIAIKRGGKNVDHRN